MSQLPDPVPVPVTAPPIQEEKKKRPIHPNSLANLKRGGTYCGGRRPEPAKLKREKVLAELAAYHRGEGDKTVHEQANAALKELILAKDGPTVRWYYDQVIGSPRTSIEHVITNTEIFEALAEVLPEFIADESICQALVVAVHRRLTE